MRRLLNKKLTKDKNSISQNYESTAYLSAMKEFQGRTKGILRTDTEYTDIRNSIYKQLRSANASRNVAPEQQVTADFDSYYINLVVVPEILECYEIMHIMQASQIYFHVEEDNPMRSKFGLTDVR